MTTPALSYNERTAGDEITVRASLCTLSTLKMLAKNEWDGKRIPPNRWGKDHFSTLLYVDARCVDHSGIPDAQHMRTEPTRAARGANAKLRDTDLLGSTRYPTRLKGGHELFGHDDWDCVDDMAEAGLVVVSGSELEPAWRLTPMGIEAAEHLRRQKAAGKPYALTSEMLKRTQDSVR